MLAAGGVIASAQVPDTAAGKPIPSKGTGFTSCGKTPISRALYQGTTEVVPNKSNQMSRALAPAETSLCFTPKLIPSPATSETQSPTPDAPAPQGTPIVTMFPHPEDSRYWISGQANII